MCNQDEKRLIPSGPFGRPKRVSAREATEDPPPLRRFQAHEGTFMTETLKLRAEALEWREVDGEIVALIKESSTYIAINSSGAVIWRARGAGASRDELIALLEG